MTTKHTPTPWRVDPNNASDLQTHNGGMEIAVVHHGLAVEVPDGVGPDQLTARANAAFIVRAVNHHEALVAMVKELRMLVRVTGPLTTARERADKLLAAIEAA